MGAFLTREDVERLTGRKREPNWNALNRPLPVAVDQVRRQRVPYVPKEGPVDCGVYFLFRRWAIVYVGQSVLPRQRMLAHWQARLIPFDSYAFVPVKSWDLAAIEAAYIGAMRPRFNQTYVSAPR